MAHPSRNTLTACGPDRASGSGARILTCTRGTSHASVAQTCTSPRSASIRAAACSCGATTLAPTRYCTASTLPTQRSCTTPIHNTGAQGSTLATNRTRRFGRRSASACRAWCRAWCRSRRPSWEARTGTGSPRVSPPCPSLSAPALLFTFFHRRLYISLNRRDFFFRSFHLYLARYILRSTFVPDLHREWLDDTL